MLKPLAGRLELVPLSAAIGRRLGITLDAPFVGWAGVEVDPKARGKRSMVLDGRRVRIVGIGGLQWREGNCWLWLDKIDLTNTSAITVVRTAQSMIQRAKALGETRVAALRSESEKAPLSKKLLELLGFSQWPEAIEEFPGVEIWVREWQL